MEYFKALTLLNMLYTRNTIFVYRKKMHKLKVICYIATFSWSKSIDKHFPNCKPILYYAILFELSVRKCYFFNGKWVLVTCILSFSLFFPTTTQTFIVLMCKLKPQTKPAAKIPALHYFSGMETSEFKETMHQRPSINRNWESRISHNSLRRHY